MARRSIVLTALLLCFADGSPSFGQESSLEIKRPLIARDVCMAMASKFATGDSISFSDGHFQVVKGTQSVTVYEGSVPITSIPGFTFSEFNHCLDIVLSSIEQARPPSDSKSLLEAYLAGYELGEIQNIGVCIQSAAMGGFYIGEKQNNNMPVQEDFIQKLVISVTKSVTRRVKRFSHQNIALGLPSDLKFYNYFPDRWVPYFTADSIASSTEAINDVTSSDYEDYVGIGQLTGRMKRTFLYGTFFSAILQMTQGFDDRARRAQTYLPSSMRCLQITYQEDRSRLLQLLNELQISMEIPDFAGAISNGQAIANDPNADNTWTERFFDERVTAKITRFIRSQP
jgi:hypothetical protein